MKKIIVALILFLTIQTIQSQDYKFGKVSKEELQEEFNPQDPEADATILYRDQSIYYDYVHDEGFVQKREFFERIKIYNKEGFKYATKVVRLYNESNSKEQNISKVKAYTYNLKDGKIVEDKLKNDGVFDEETNEYWKTRKFTMPNIQEGCIVEYKYTIESPFLTIDEINFQEAIPIKKLDFKISSPEYYNYKTVVNLKAGYLPKIDNSTTGKKYHISYVLPPDPGMHSGARAKSERVEYDKTITENIIKVNEENIPALKDEPMVDNLDNYRAKIRFELEYVKYPNEPIESFSTTWESVSKKIFQYPEFGEELKKSSYYKDDVDAITSGVSDPVKKIQLIFNFVKSKVKWNGYNGYYTSEGVRKAYKEGSGNIADINLMLVSMLRHVGLDADPVLVSTKDNGIPLFPTRNGFNYVIAIVQTPQGNALLDATSKLSTPNLLPIKLLNWQGRLIKKDGSSSWVSLNAATPSKEIRMLNAELNVDELSASGKVRNQFTDYQALNFREKHIDLSNDEIIKSKEEDYNNLEVSELEIKSIDELSKPVSQSYTFKLIDAIEHIGENLYFSPFLHFVPDENPFKSETRDYPIDFIYPIADKYMINIKLPEGYIVETLPENAKVQFGNDGSEFTYLLRQNGNLIQIIMTFNLNKTLILPEEYLDFKQFYQMFIDKQSEKIVLKKG